MASIVVELPNGTELEFPEGTSDSIIQQAVSQELGLKTTSDSGFSIAGKIGEYFPSVESGIRSSSPIEELAIASLPFTSELGGDTDFVKEYVTSRQKSKEAISRLPPEEVDQIRAIQEGFDEGFWKGLTATVKNPAGAGTMLGQSLGASLKPLAIGAAGAVGGPVTGIAAYGGASGFQKGLELMDEGFAEVGVDPTNEEQVRAALQDENFTNALKGRMLRGGLGQGIVDTLFLGLGGKLSKVAAPTTRTGKVGTAVGEVGIQTVGEGAGEAAAQLGSRGEVYSPGDVRAEAVLGLPTAGGEVLLSNMMNRQTEQPVPVVEEAQPAPVVEEPMPPEQGQPSVTAPFYPVTAQDLKEVILQKSAEAERNLPLFTPSAPITAVSEQVTTEPAPVPSEVALITPISSELAPLTPRSLFSEKSLLSNNPLSSIEEVPDTLAPLPFEEVKLVPDTLTVSSFLAENPSEANTDVSNAIAVGVSLDELKGMSARTLQEISTLADLSNKAFDVPQIDTTVDKITLNRSVGRPPSNKLSIIPTVFTRQSETGATQPRTTPEMPQPQQGIPPASQERLTVKPSQTVPSVVQPIGINPVTETTKRRLRKNVVVPTVVRNNLKAVKPIPSTALDKAAKVFRKQAKTYARGLDLLIDSTLAANPSTPSTEPVLKRTEPVNAAQTILLTKTALNYQNTTVQMDDALSEAWFYYKNSGLVDKADKSLLTRKRQNLVNFVASYYGVPPGSLMFLTEDKNARTFLESLAFSVYADKYRKKQPMGGLPIEVNSLFKKVVNSLENIGKTFSNNGITSEEQLFQDTAANPQINPVINANQNIAAERLTEYAQEKGAAFITKALLDSEARAGQALKQKEAFDSFKDITWWGRYITSKFALASRNPAFASLFQTLQDRQEVSNQLVSEYVDRLKDFLTKTEQNKKLQNDLHDLAALQRQMRFRTIVRPDGSLIYKDRQGELKVLPKKEADAYTALQNFYKFQLDSMEALTRANLPSFGFPDITTPVQVLEKEASQRAIAAEGRELTADEAKELDVFLETVEMLAKIEDSRQSDYVPFTRNGNKGIVVKDKETDETLAMYDIVDSGRVNFGQNMRLNEIKEDIKDKGYDDTNKYKIFGLKGKLITSPGSLKAEDFFTLTNDQLYRQFATTNQNIDALMDLLRMSPDSQEYKKVANLVSAERRKRAVKGVLLKQSRNLDGYSKDWQRVMTDFPGKASHHTANLVFRRELDALKQFANNLPENLRKKFISDVDYFSEPESDFNFIRAMTHFFGMALNVSSGIMQFAGIPTVILPQLAAISPMSAPRTIPLTSKWMGIATASFAPFFKQVINPKLITVDPISGGVNLDVTAPEFLDFIEKIKGISPDAKQFLIERAKDGTISSQFIQEQASTGKTDSRSLAGAISRKIRKLGNASGLVVSNLEMLSKFVTLGVAYDTFKDPSALAAARKFYRNDQNYQEMRRRSTSPELWDLAKFFTQDTTGVYGKLNRPQYHRGATGAMFFGLTSYVQYMAELLWRNLSQRGLQGKLAAFNIIGSIALLAGIMGLPGAEELDKLLKLYYKEVKGQNFDLNLFLREYLDSEGLPAPLVDKMVQGIGRDVGGFDISSRLQLGSHPLVSTAFDVIPMLTGDSKQPVGIGASILTNFSNAVKEAAKGNLDKALIAAAPSGLPKGLATLYSEDYQNLGITNKSGDVLVSRNEIERNPDFYKKALLTGFTPETVTKARQRKYMSGLKDKEFQGGQIQFKDKMEKARITEVLAKARGDSKTAAAARQAYRDAQTELMQYNKEHGLKTNFTTLRKNLDKKAKAALQGSLPPTSLSKQGRKKVGEIERLLDYPQSEGE